MRGSHGGECRRRAIIGAVEEPPIRPARRDDPKMPSLAWRHQRARSTTWRGGTMTPSRTRIVAGRIAIRGEVADMAAPPARPPSRAAAPAEATGEAAEAQLEARPTIACSNSVTHAPNGTALRGSSTWCENVAPPTAPPRLREHRAAARGEGGAVLENQQLSVRGHPPERHGVQGGRGIDREESAYRTSWLQPRERELDRGLRRSETVEKPASSRFCLSPRAAWGSGGRGFESRRPDGEESRDARLFSLKPVASRRTEGQRYT